MTPLNARRCSVPLNVGVQNPDGRLVVARPESEPRELAVTWRGGAFAAALTARTVVTYR